MDIDFGRAIKAPFNDKDWGIKTVLGFIWSLLIVTAPAITGAQLDYIKGVAQDDEALPTWDHFGDKWVRGLLVMIAGFIYFLPVVILSFMLFVPAIAVGGASSGSDAIGLLFAGTGCLFAVVTLVYTIAVTIFYYAAVVHFAMRGDFGALFDFAGIMSKVRGGSGYFTAWLYTLGISFLASFVAGVLASTGLGALLIPAIAYLQVMMTGHVLGQWARNAYGIAPTSVPPTGPGQVPTYPAPPAPPAPSAYTTPPAPTYIAPPAPSAPPAPVAEPSAPDTAEQVAPAADDGSATTA